MTKNKSPLVVYTLAMSAHAARVLMLLEELSAEYHLRSVDLPTENRGEAFLKLNPNGKVPVIDDGGFVLWDSHAIMRYLCNKHGPTEHYPTDINRRAEVDQWLEWGHTRLNPEAVTINFNTVILRENGDREAVNRSKTNLDTLLPILNNALENRQYLCDALSIADLSLFTSTVYLKQNAVDLSRYNHLNRWYQAIEQRPSAKKVLSRDGDLIHFD